AAIRPGEIRPSSRPKPAGLSRIQVRTKAKRGRPRAMSDEADIAQITEGMTKAIGAESGLNSTLKFDFEGKGVVFIDGKAKPNAVSNENKPADCTITVSLDTFKKMVARELDGTAAFMQGKLKVAGDMSVAMKLGPILAKAAPQ